MAIISFTLIRHGAIYTRIHWIVHRRPSISISGLSSKSIASSIISVRVPKQTWLCLTVLADTCFEWTPHCAKKKTLKCVLKWQVFWGQPQAECLMMHVTGTIRPEPKYTEWGVDYLTALSASSQCARYVDVTRKAIIWMCYASYVGMSCMWNGTLCGSVWTWCRHRLSL